MISLIPKVWQPIPIDPASPKLRVIIGIQLWRNSRFFREEESMARLHYFSDGLGVLNARQEVEFQNRQMDLYRPTLKKGVILVSCAIWALYFVGKYKAEVHPRLGLYCALYQVLLIGNFLMLNSRRVTRILLKYFTPIYPILILYFFMTLYAPYLPSSGLILQTQVVPILILVAIYSFEKLRPNYAIVSAILYTIVFLYLRLRIPVFAQLPQWQVVVQVVFAHVLGLFLVFDQGRSARIQFKLEKDLEKKKIISDKLIERVFPGSVAKELRTKKTNMARIYPDVTILFADIVNYTKITAITPPKQLVALLHEMFHQFDNLAERHGVEKIKTIGDAYMAAAGCPENAPDHAERVARFAISLMKQIDKFNRKFGTDFSIRIGIHTGPVIGGVISDKRISFDLWGDAVNLTSRIQTNADPGEILVSEAAAKILHTSFMLSDSCIMELKGVGSTSVWRLGEERKLNIFPSKVGNLNFMQITSDVHLKSII